MSKVKSWVWDYAHRKNNKAYCDLCDKNDSNEFSCPGGTTGSLGRHLIRIHGIQPTKRRHIESEQCDTEEVETAESDIDQGRSSTGLSLEQVSQEESYAGQSSQESSQSQSFLGQLSQPHSSQLEAQINIKRRSGRPAKTLEKYCSQERKNAIHEALAQLIALNQLPLSFCTSVGFRKFMEVVEPTYIPCSEDSLKKRLDSMKKCIQEKIKSTLDSSEAVACTTDCWSSRAQDSFLTLTCHSLDENWVPHNFTLETCAMDDRHLAVNLANQITSICKDYNIQNKVKAIVTDNAANIINATKIILNEDHQDTTCAAHTLQLAINKALEQEDIQAVISKCNKLVAHFKHSNMANDALQKKQEQLGLPMRSLRQSCRTRWNSTYAMLERLLQNRSPVTNVLADRRVATNAVAVKFEVTEREWSAIENLVVLLKPLQVITSIFCTNRNSPTSMVRPLIHKLLQKHLSADPTDVPMVTNFKQTIQDELTRRFGLERDTTHNNITVRQISSLLDPRYKDLEHESYDARSKIRDYVKQTLTSHEVTVNDQSDVSANNSALEFLYQEEMERNSVSAQWDEYVAEPQIRFNLDPFEWWKARKGKYPTLETVARKYLCIPATSADSERNFSTAGNIVTAKRSSLLPENINTLIFLHQNRHLL